MPAPQDESRILGTAAPRPERRTGSARSAARNGGNAESAPRIGGNGARRGPDGQARSKWTKGALRDLFRGLRAGDLESVLLTVAMAAEENRTPSADLDEAARILAFLTRLAEYDAALPPPCPNGVGTGPNHATDAE